MRTADLDFELATDRIATAPAEPRDAARLMVVHRDTGRVEHTHVRDLPTLGVFRPGDLMVVNRTRVLPAHLTGVRTATGGKITGLFVQSPSVNTWDVMLESRGKLQAGETIDLFARGKSQPAARLTLREPRGRGEWRVDVTADGPTDPPTLLARAGQTPLPPYIRKTRKARELPEFRSDDAQRYNTVFAEPENAAASVAAPTAGLHFTSAVLDALDQIGVRRAAVTLHVGLGTFLPVQTDTLEAHPIHSEWIDVPPETLNVLRETQAAANPGGGNKAAITAVGTTTVRTLESLPETIADLDRHTGDTDLFITPQRVAAGEFAFRFTDHLLTNFHLPRSTLLALVAALPGVGVERLLDWYREAIARGYRFYSFGDAMLIV